MREPLFNRADQDALESADASTLHARTHAWLCMLRRLVQHWWVTTTDKRYLQSELGFRHRWPWLLPLFSLMWLMVDA
eukprot:3696479-Amphidinium_carterae.1